MFERFAKMFINGKYLSVLIKLNVTLSIYTQNNVISFEYILYYS